MGPKPVWTLWRKKEPWPPAEILQRIPGLPAYSVVTRPTEPSLVLECLIRMMLEEQSWYLSVGTQENHDNSSGWLVSGPIFQRGTFRICSTNATHSGVKFRVLTNMFVSFFVFCDMGTLLLFQRWERENAKLPAHLQRTAPEKPSNPLSVEQWNAFAWEASQVSGP